MWKSPATAIEVDLNGCIASHHASEEKRSAAPPSMVVKYFKPNESRLFAVVECVFVAPEGCAILAELIATSAGEDKYLFLEEVSLITD